MSVPALYRIDGRTAAELAASCERAIRDGALGTGDRLPTVRELARTNGTSPATVASAYRLLQDRGLVVAEGRRGTRVAPRPPLPAPRPIAPPIPLSANTLDLRTGQPDRSFLPDLRPVLARTPAPETLPRRSIERNVDRLFELAADRFVADGVAAAHLAVVGGALDGVESVLQAHVVRGSRVGVEDPTYPPFLDLLRGLGARPVPIAVDEQGLRPDALERALAAGINALIVTPRAQNPTGAATSRKRAAELRRMLAGRDLLVVEDDHAAPIAGAPLNSLTTARVPSWAQIRSVTKSLSPDLRLAVVAGDAVTIARLDGRQALGRGWISTILQHAVAALWDDPATADLLARARAAYTERRESLVHELAAHGVEAPAPSGLNVWVPVREEAATVEALLARGWAVAGGEPFRLRSGPAVRVTVAELPPERSAVLAADIAACRQLSSTIGRY